MKTIWDKYHYDRHIIDEFLEAFEIKIKGCIEQINWKNTLSKILVWDGFNMDLKYDYASLIINRQSTYSKSFVKWIVYYSQRKKINSSATFPKELFNCEILFFLRNKGEVEILFPLLEQLQHKTKFQLVFEHDDTKKEYSPWNFIKFENIIPNTIPFKWRVKKIPSKKALFVFNASLREIDSMKNYSSFFYHLKKTNPNLRKIIFVAGENKYVPSLCHQIFKNSQVETENLMNGAKYGWPNDADVDFDRWYVWNEKMKTFLANNAKVNPHILKVVGHPLQDNIKNHVYTNKNEKLNEFKGKFNQVITLFSTSLQFDNKLKIYKKVVEFVSQNPQLGLIVKIHNNDTDVSFFDSIKGLSQVVFFEGFTKSLVWDILYCSNLSISFGSTVSFESVWMGVPNISYEEEEDTLLPIEDELFFHTNNTEDILPKIQMLLNNNTTKKQNTSQVTVLDKYVNSILN